jgi:hypothetical protein
VTSSEVNKLRRCIYIYILYIYAYIASTFVLFPPYHKRSKNNRESNVESQFNDSVTQISTTDAPESNFLQQPFN